MLRGAVVAVLCFCVCHAQSYLLAQTTKSADGAPANAGLTLTPTRTITYTTSEGTWLSLDLSPDGQTILFDLVGHLYTMPVAGGDAKAITSGLEFDKTPRYSPDGKKIVFISDRSGADNLWIANVDGSDARPLTDAENTGYVSPIWTPDGSYIIVSQKKPQYYDSGFELWMYDIKGGSGVRITKAKPSEEANPETWHNALGAVVSPDGHYIYYARKLGYFSSDIKLPLWQIARRDLQTGEEDIITGNQGSAIRPVLSPDGIEMAYGTRIDGATELRIRNLTTGDDRRLAYPIQRDDQETYFSSRDLLPGYIFTHDGKSLLLAYGGKIHQLSIDTGKDTIIPFEAKVVREMGPHLDFPARVDQGPVHARIIQGAVESPDGKQIAFSSLLHLYVKDLPNGEARRLTSEDAGEYEPTWSPDGKWIAYVTWQHGNGYLWKTAADGSGKPIQLTAVSAYYSDPIWSPDGEQIVLLRTSREMAMEQIDQWGKPMEGLELVSVPAAGGDIHRIAFAANYAFPQFAGSSDRIFVSESHKVGGMKKEHSLVSMRLDGTDKRTLLILKDKDIWGADFSPNVQILPSPDKKQALAVYRAQLYIFDLPQIGGEPPTIDLSSPAVAVRRLTNVGADFASWAGNGDQITWTLGASYFRIARNTVNEGLAETPTNKDKDAPPQGNLPKAAARFHPEEVHVDISVPRYEPKGTVVLRGAKVITMHGDEIIRAADIVMRDNRILAVGAKGSVTVPRGATIINVSGKTIVPGYIDAHAHWFHIRRGILDTENWDFLASLAFGITTGRDPQTFTNDVFVYQDLVDAGEIPGPRAYSTGPGIFWVNDFHTEKEAEDVIQRYKDYYKVNTIKSYMVGNREQREFVVEASNKLHMMPTTEGAADLPLDVTHAIDGFSGNEHQFPMALNDDLIQLFAKSGIYYDPTFIIGYGGPASENYYFENTKVHDNPKVQRFIPHDVIDSRTSHLTWYRKDEYAYPSFAKSAADMIKAGGKVCVGGHGEFEGLSYHWELWSLQSGGMSNMDALRAATLTGAEAIGMAQDLGSIEPGKLADMVVLDADPLTDIHNSIAIHYVIKNGEVFDGNTLDEVWPAKKPLPEMYWQK
jgi:Tol biopolymer transport system component/imidazolonepropionase-like amidohydrolase